MKGQGVPREDYMEMAVSKGYRVNFTIPFEMSEKAANLAKELDQSLSEFARNALQKAIDSVEKAKLREELRKGYAADYQSHLAQQQEWQYADSE